ncbi:MAG TPA: protein phosphatase CheZ [Pseudolabrys sp.]|nr:protein phosphatase CheZ [Pseudolabrys sp.]
MQRKVFRIEAMLAPRRQPGAGLAMRAAAQPASASDNVEALMGLKAELAFVHEQVAHNKRELTALIGEDSERRLVRAGNELSAAVAAMRGATDTILGTAEAADDSARTLAASLTDEFKRGLAQDIQEQIVRIYEACNFQDIAGQHIGKVIGTLAAVESQLEAILARCDGVHAVTAPLDAPVRGSGLLNGPKLTGDAGHATQGDIDRMFA